MHEIIVDNFAGGGGASTGIEMATGRCVDIAINHDEHAIAMHTTNHPNTLHYCESVFDIKPKEATAGRKVALAWFSPDCRHFSKAKGAKPVEKAIRGLAWVVVRWALDVSPRVIALENVQEFKTWGPLVEATQMPDPARAGETFEAFCSILSVGISPEHPGFLEACEFLKIHPASAEAKRLIKGLGYAIEFRELVASDYGTPQKRTRFFMVMRCDGEKIVWPEPTHGDPNSEKFKRHLMQPWKTAADCIDFSIEGNSIFGRQRPLAENTLRRVARGLERFVLDSASPFIVKCNHTSSKTTYDCFRGQSLDEPLQTITRKHGFAVVVPHLTKFRTGAVGIGLDEPVPTVTAGTSKRPGGNGHALGKVDAILAPYIAGAGGSEYQGRPRAVFRPMHTIKRDSRACLVMPFLARQFGKSIGHRADEPNGTITSGGGGKSQLVAPTLIQVGYGERPGQAPRAPGLHKPLGTVVAGGGKHALVAAHITKNFGGNYTGPGVAASEPLHTVTTVDHHSLVTSHLVKLYGTCRDGQQSDQPMPTVTAGGQHIGHVAATMINKHQGCEVFYKHADAVEAFLKEQLGNDVSPFIEFEGITYRIVDISIRMLQPRELYRAQGFPDWYVIDRDYRGVKYAKDRQVARCGNAVPPQLVEALVRANLPELCAPAEQVA